MIFSSKQIIKSGKYKNNYWYLIQTNSGNLGSLIDYQMVVPGIMNSDYFRSLESWSIKRQLTQVKSFINLNKER